ncbi:MAG: exosortase [Sphingomonadales bacterium]|nr:exosortase [Sphingomonadales bacterium]
MTIRTQTLTAPVKASATGRPTAARWTVLAALALASTAMLSAHAETVAHAVSIWNSSDTYQIAWVALPTLAYLMWHHRARFSALALTGSALGVVAAGACAALWLAGDLMNMAEARHFALVAGICATVYAALGWPSFRMVATFLTLLVFLVPTGTFLLTPLKYTVIGFAKTFAFFTGIPFQNEGFRIYVGAQRYVVIDECAGLPYLLMGLFLGLTLGLLLYRRWWRIAMLTALGGVLGIVANGIRVSGIIAYDYVTGSELDLAGHGYFALPALAVSFAILFFVFHKLQPEREPAAGLANAGAPLGRAYAPILPALLAAAVMAAPPVLLRDAGDVQAQAPALVLPASPMGWTQQSYVGDWSPRASTTGGTWTLVEYARGNERIAAFVAEARSRADKISGAGIDLSGGGNWMLVLRERPKVCAEGSCHEVTHDKYVLRDTDRIRHVYRVYNIGGSLTASKLDLRMRRAWRHLSEGTSQARLIAIATEDPEGLPAADIASLQLALVETR